MRSLTIQEPLRLVVVPRESSLDDNIPLPSRVFQLDLCLGLLRSLFDIALEIVCASHDLPLSAALQIPISAKLSTFGGKPSPMAMAAAMVLFPVPLGPRIMLRCGPGANSMKSYVMKPLHLILVMEPATKLASQIAAVLSLRCGMAYPSSSRSYSGLNST